jgi:hypothetical protein
MALKLIPVGNLTVWSTVANVLQGPGPVTFRSLSAFTRALWEGDGFVLDSHIGMGGFVMGPEVAHVDVRLAFHDPEGVNLFFDYTSRASMPTLLAEKSAAYLSGRVDVDDTAKKYAWLNRTQIVGRGMMNAAERTVKYELYALE